MMDIAYLTLFLIEGNKILCRSVKKKQQQKKHFLKSVQLLSNSPPPHPIWVQGNKYNAGF